MESFRNIEQNIPVCSAFNNMVDKDIQLVLWPLNLCQFISSSPKYRIKNNYITPNSFIVNLFSIIGVIMFISLYIFRTYLLFLNTEYFMFTKFVSVTPFIDCVYYSFGFAMNFAIGVIQSNNNIKLILVFQRVHRLLNNETRFNQFIIWNWITVVLVLGPYFLFLTYVSLQHPLTWLYFIHYLLFVFDLNVLYANQVLKLLEHKLELWNELAINSLKIEGNRGEDFSKRMFQAYSDILECYEMHKACFQSFILYYMVEVFLHSLINIEVTIEMTFETLKVNLSGPVLGLLSMLAWISKNLTWLTMFMQRCETFYVAVENIRDSCALILMTNCSDHERKLCKNVLRLQRASFSKLRVCGLFHAGAALQLSLLSLLANYTVVLLQFAIL